MSKFGGKIGCWGGMAYNDNYGQVGVQVWGGLNNTDGGGNRVADGLVRQEQGVV